MTRIRDVKLKCAVCGKNSQQKRLLSTNIQGFRDLDMRPPEMERSTIDTWVQRCPFCGYCAPEISELLSGAPEIVKTNSYQKLLKDPLYLKKIETKLTDQEKETLQKYLKESEETPPLTEAVEKELIRRSKEGDEEAKRKLVKANLKLIVSIAKNYISQVQSIVKNYISQTQSVTLLKLIEKGILGLSKAIAPFNYSKGYKFPQYATRWIHGLIIKEIVDQTLTNPELANNLLCQSLIEEKSDNFVDAGWSALYAAWVCDDNKNNKGARKCRKKAINLFKQAKERGQKFAENEETEKLIMVDLMRRSGQFKSALKICNEELRENPSKTTLRILQFQKSLISNSDTGCHTMEEAIPIEERVNL